MKKDPITIDSDTPLVEYSMQPILDRECIRIDEGPYRNTKFVFKDIEHNGDETDPCISFGIIPIEIEYAGSKLEELTGHIYDVFMESIAAPILMDIIQLTIKGIENE